MLTNLIVDVEDDNSIMDLKLASKSGLVGMIHKASEGIYPDNAYVARRSVARNLGLLWGAYHFGRTGNPVGQAEFFLKVVGDDTTTLLCLDLERDLSGHLMPLLDAEIFVQKIKNATGRWPVVYTANWVMNDINPNRGPTLLSKCPLWVASDETSPLIPKEWSTWSLWQYTNGQTGRLPHSIPGLGHNDYDVYNGTLDELRAWWAGGSGGGSGNSGGEKPVADKTMQVNTDKLNVRLAPNTKAEAPYQLTKGKKVVVDPASAVTADGHTWYEVKHWVAAEYLSDPRP